METPETIRTSLQQGEWVTSVDFKDAYFHIPIQEQSRKYLRFHVQGRIYQFKALPFGLSTAAMEFTVLAKEVKLMAIHRGIRIHQYLDVPRRLVGESQIPTNLSPTRPNPGQNVPGPRLAGEFREIRAGTQTGLRLCRLPVRPQVRPGQTNSGQDTSLQDKIQALLLLPACPVRQFMSLIGLLTATEKQVHLGRLHMRPIQWHLKNNWRVPESL